MPAKKTHQVSLKGLLSLEEMTVTEVVKEEEYTYNFADIIREFNDKNVSITIKEEDPIPTMEEQ